MCVCFFWGHTPRKEQYPTQCCLALPAYSALLRPGTFPNHGGAFATALAILDRAARFLSGTLGPLQLVRAVGQGHFIFD